MQFSCFVTMTIKTAAHQSLFGANWPTLYLPHYCHWKARSRKREVSFCNFISINSQAGLLLLLCIIMASVSFHYTCYDTSFKWHHQPNQMHALGPHIDYRNPPMIKQALRMDGLLSVNLWRHCPSLRHASRVHSFSRVDSGKLSCDWQVQDRICPVTCTRVPVAFISVH